MVTVTLQYISLKPFLAVTNPRVYSTTKDRRGFAQCKLIKSIVAYRAIPSPAVQSVSS